MDPTDIDVEEARALSILRRARSVQVGKILTYTPTTNRARVELGLLGMTAQGIADVPLILPSVPILYLRGRGSGVFVEPDVGDDVLLLVADRSLDRWLTAGGPVALDSDRMHELTDAIGIAGLSPSSKPLPASAAVSTIVGREDGTATLALTRAGPGGTPVPSVATLEANAVRLGLGATHPAVLGDTLVNALLALFSAIASANTTWTGNPATGPAFSTALGTALATVLPLLPTSLSAKVQVE